MYFKRTPRYISQTFSQLRWRYPDSQNIYLTFDDGPHLDSTPRLLHLLDKLDVKASFFCLGNNVEKYPKLKDQIQCNGHLLAYHGYDHISGWTSDNDVYLDNVKKCEEHFPSNFFRPPYGRIKPSQIKRLTNDYKIIMWDVMPGDFDPKVNAETLYLNLIKNTKGGSIIVLHDNPSTIEKLERALPPFVEKMRSEGLDFDIIH